MEEDEWEEEEQLVVAELSGVIDSDVLLDPRGVCKVVGVDSDQPIVQVGRYVFAGEYEDAACSCVVFEAHGEERALRYKCHTAKKLLLQRTFVSERKEDEPSSGGIEVLTINEGKMSGRSSVLCRYAKDQSELDGSRTREDDDDDEGPAGSEESDTETRNDAT